MNNSKKDINTDSLGRGSNSYIVELYLKRKSDIPANHALTLNKNMYYSTKIVCSMSLKIKFCDEKR